MPRQRMSSPALVGRDEELAGLMAALSRSMAGEPQMVFVAGEAGVGKTRLARELAARAAACGVRVWTGHCIPLGGQLLPYAPIAEVFQAAIAGIGLERLRSLAGPMADRFAALVPQLGEVAVDPWPALDDKVQARWWAQVLWLLNRLVAEPVLVILEDLHWADSSTRGLLSLLSRGMSGPLLVVCTYRDDEVSATHPLRPLLAELHRAGAERMSLGRLDCAATRAQVAAILRGEPDPQWLERLYDRSGGNPFFVEELVAAGPGQPTLTEGLRDLLLLRFRQLDARAQRAVRAVAVAGRAAEHTLLADALAMPSDTITRALGAAVDSHVLVPSGDRYAFRHTLAAEAVVADTWPGERIALHRALAEALEARLARGGPPTAARVAALAETAHHWFAAGDADRAVVSTIDAGLAAQRTYALAEAHRHFQRGLSLWWQAASGRGMAALDLIGLNQHTAQTAYSLGLVDAALALIHEAIALVDAATDPIRAGLLHEQRGRYLLGGGHSLEATRGAFEIAAQLVPPAVTAERARVLTGLASIRMMGARLAESIVLAREAVAIAQEVGAQPEEAHGLATLGVGQVLLGEPDAGLGALRDALSLATQANHPVMMWRSYLNLSAGLLYAGRLTESADIALTGLATLDAIGLPEEERNCLLGNALDALFWIGRWDEVAERVEGIGDPRRQPALHLNRWLGAAALWTALGRFEEAQRCFDGCRAVLDGAHFELIGDLCAGRAELYLWRGDPQTAWDWLTESLRRLDGAGHGPMEARLLALQARACADLAAVDASVAQSRAAVLREKLVQLPGGPDQPKFARAHCDSVAAELSRLDGAAIAAAAWARAALTWHELGCPYPVAYAHWRQAEALLAQGGRRRAAARVLALAQAEAESLGAEPLRQEIVALAKRARLEIEPRLDAAPGPPRGQDRLLGFGLTAREEDVLKLVAVGKTNRQIARLLFISEKTVSIHVSRVLAKLAVPNRAAAAAIAHRLGMSQ